MLRPEHPDNYYAAFDLVPVKYRPLLQAGKVLITNWHAFAPESEHKEGDKSYAVVNKGPETPDTFARRVLGDLADRMPIMVLNDEGHHCWRPGGGSRRRQLLTGESAQGARGGGEGSPVWLDGLDRINNAMPGEGPGIALCVDLSATPFYIKGSGHPEGHPFPWLVSDFGLVDAIESGIVKIPRLPVQDTDAGRPDPNTSGSGRPSGAGSSPREVLPGAPRTQARGGLPGSRRRAEADRRAVGRAVRYIQGATPGQERIPPVLISSATTPTSRRSSTARSAARPRSRPSTEEEVEDVPTTRRRKRTRRRPAGAARSRRRPRSTARRGVPGVLLQHARAQADDPHRLQAAGRSRERRRRARTSRTPPRNCAGSSPPSASRASPASMCAASSRSRCSPKAGTPTTSPTSSASAPSAASSSASRSWGAACAAWTTIPDPDDRPADRGVCRRLRHPVLGDPLQGAAGDADGAGGQAEEPRARPAGAGRHGDALPRRRGLRLRAHEEPHPLRHRTDGAASHRAEPRTDRHLRQPDRRLPRGQHGRQPGTLWLRHAGPFNLLRPGAPADDPVPGDAADRRRADRRRDARAQRQAPPGAGPAGTPPALPEGPRHRRALCRPQGGLSGRAEGRARPEAICRPGGRAHPGCHRPR